MSDIFFSRVLPSEKPREDSPYVQASSSFPRPDVLVIRILHDGVLLEGLTKQGMFTGDTWHQDVAAAKSQAEFQYGSAVTEWRVVPSEISDWRPFVLEQI